MLTITATCICNAASNTGINTDNLLFSGQILPEINGGLAGTPTLKSAAETPFFTAVLDGDSARVSHFAASTLREAVSPDLRSPKVLLQGILDTLAADTAAGARCGAAVVCVSADRLSLATADPCRVYLLRDRSLFLIPRAPDAPEAPAEPLYAVTGTPIAGDRLLLCTHGLWSALEPARLLEYIYGSRSGADALLQLVQQARAAGAQGSLTAVLLRFD